MVSRSCPVALLITTALVALAAVQVDILSDHDNNYKALAKLQEAVCNAHPTHPCMQSEGQCERMMKQLNGLLFPGDDPAQKDAVQKLFQQICSVQGTRYELPGVHWLLQQRFDSVNKLSREQGITLPSPIVYGAIPLPSVNAEVQVDSKTGVPMILVNMRLLEFANEFSKVAAQTIPVDRTAKQLGFDQDPDATRRKIMATPKLREYLIGLIDYFYGKGKAAYLQPDEISKTVQIVYTEGMETFAMAHEIGHVYYKHGSSSFDLSQLADNVRSLLSLSRPALSTSIRETEADGFALRAVLQRRDDAVKGDSDNPFFTAVLHAAEFYFIAQQILDEAGEMSHESAQAPVPYDGNLASDVARVEGCVLKRDCRVSEISGLSKQLREGNQHPSHQFRADLISAVIKDRPPAKNADWLLIADLVNRNAKLLWDETKEEYANRHKMN